MRRADSAMYQARETRCGFEFYARERDTNSCERLVLAAELAAAIEHGGIEVHFQPKADTQSRKMVGVEALVRWRRDDGRLVPPADFVLAAERAGLSRPLTRKVIEIALDQLQPRRGTSGDATSTSPSTRRWPTCSTWIFRLKSWKPSPLAVFRPMPSCLRSRVLGAGGSAAYSSCAGTARRGRHRGVAGRLRNRYSSLTHVKSLPVGEVKVDRSFVVRMCTDATGAGIVFATIHLAAKLGIRVVAEGVEDEQTWDALSAMNCDLNQGFLLSKPVPAAELEPQLAAYAIRKAEDARLGAVTDPGAPRAAYEQEVARTSLTRRRHRDGGVGADRARCGDARCNDHWRR